MKALYAEFTARAGCEEQVRSLVSALALDVRSEPGNLAFAPHTLAESPRRWFVYEEYADDAAFDAHITAPYGLAFNAALAPLIEEDGSQLTWLTPQ